MSRTAVAIRHVGVEDLGILAPVLTGHGYGVTYLDAGIDPIDTVEARNADVLVVLGGPIGVTDVGSYPFLREEILLVRARIEQGMPVLGVCLGAQLIATALGAPVTSTGRVEIGYAPLTLTPEGRAGVLGAIGDHPVLHWHGDQFAVPDGALRLAETPGCPNQAFSRGDTLLGLQFHLEADHERIERWLISHAHELATNGIDVPALRADAHRHGPLLVERGRQVFDAWFDALGR